ncbi:MAG: hypothetical protein ACSNEK_04980 [Parachlamydiaceae bacterium]
MANIISNSTINRFVICCTLGAFTIATLNPIHATPLANINLMDINFGFKIESLIQNAKKYFTEKNSRKLTEVMWDIKREIECYTGQKINIDYHLDQIEKTAKSRGQPIDKAYMKEIRK